MDVAEDTGPINELAAMIVDAQLKAIRYYAALGVDGVMMVDDRGTQNSLLVSRETWLRFFKPRWREMVAAIKGVCTEAFSVRRDVRRTPHPARIVDRRGYRAAGTERRKHQAGLGAGPRAEGSGVAAPHANTDRVHASGRRASSTSAFAFDSGVFFSMSSLNPTTCR